MAPKDKDPITKKVESYIDTSAVNMGVMKNTLQNLLEILQKGSKNTRRPLSLYLTTVTHRSQHQHQQLHYSGKRGPEPNKSNQRGSIHKGQ